MSSEFRGGGGLNPLGKPLVPGSVYSYPVDHNLWRQKLRSLLSVFDDKRLEKLASLQEAL